jgi:hypothetical protein
MKTIFHYDENTGGYLGQNVADVDPATGNALLPAHATDIAPPALLGVKFNIKKGCWEGIDPAAVVVELPKPVEIVEDIILSSEDLDTTTPDVLTANTPGDMEERVPAKNKRRRGRPRS